uniref:Uncharacterized protein n=1 Tax=Arundo donax TaxID=35708 RepID=A0A0A8XSE8_ARUDO
MAHFPVTTT